MKYWKYLIVFLLIWSAISDFFVSKLSFLNFVDEAIVLLLLLHIVIDALANIHNDRTSFRFSKTSLLIFFLIIWSFISCIVNWSSLPQLFKFLFSVSKGFIVFYWVKNFIQHKAIVKEVLIIIQWLILIQLPFFAVGLLVFRAGYIGDNAVGAIFTGDASTVGTYFWLGIIICLAQFEEERNKKHLYYALILSGLLIVTSTKQLTILLPIVLLYLYSRRLKRFNLRLITFVTIGVGTGVLLYGTVERKWMANYGVDTSEINLLNYLDESEKLMGYYSLLYELPEEIKHPMLLGAGPGMYGSYVAMNARTRLSQKYIMDYYDKIPEGLGGTLAYRSSSIIAFWGDTGLVGLIIILSLYLYQTFHFAKRMRISYQRVLYSLIIGTGFLLMTQSFILNVFEGNTFTLNLFWILCGISATGIFKPRSKLLNKE